MEKSQIRISVRGLVEFILRSGDIDNRHVQSPENAMLEGGRIHRMIQNSMGPYYHPEVSLRYQIETERYELTIEGRADGVEDRFFGMSSMEVPSGEISGEKRTAKNGSGRKKTQVTSMSEHLDAWTVAKTTTQMTTLSFIEQPVLVDEIKGTYRDLKKIKEPVLLHEAQAKCYAYIYALQNGLDNIRIRVTYCNLDTEEKKLFEKDFFFEELEDWFLGVLARYRKWADYTCEWNEKRTESVHRLAFPYPYREGQKELVTYVYQTIYHQRKLFIEAPTGVGKTLSTVFPSVKAVGEHKADKIFYLTAKTITRTVAEETFALLRKRGLLFKTVTLTAKEKICFCEEVECNPEACPYARGHFDRINDAMYDFITHEDSFDRERVEHYARRHQVCPFEMCLDMSLFADAVICDYNYAFDPHVYLRRFFADTSGQNYLFLIDEAHNLVDRGREMYSATLRKEDFLAMKKVVKEFSTDMERKLEKCNKLLLEKKKNCENYRMEEEIAPFVNALNRLKSSMDKYLEDHEESPIRKELLDFYFQVSHFLEMYELMDENYVVYTEMESDGSFIIKEFCVNPSKNLAACMARARSTVLFSATFLPIQYYKELLGGTEEDYEVYAHSVFDSGRRGLFIGSDVTSKYTRRSELEYYNIASYIHAIIRERTGNYLVFCPSHAFLEQVYTAYADHFQDENRVECILQEDFMREEEREAFLQKFRAGKNAASVQTGQVFPQALQNNAPVSLEELIQFPVEYEEEKSLVGFCVMGGIFSEGIDLKNDSLIGAIIVGTGLPQVCNEREILKKHFDARGENGFDYAYRYPGMNKVLQAAGRVIRTVEDLGIVALLDERFLQGAYQKMFPREWEHFEVVTTSQIGKRVERFWNEWL